MKQQAASNNPLADPKAFIRSMIAQIDFKFRTYGDAPNVINLYLGRGMMMTVPLEWDDATKIETLDVLKLLIRVLEPEAYAVLAETWCAPPPCEGENFARPSQHPERQEGILCLLVGARGEKLAGHARIRRNADGSYSGHDEIRFDVLGTGLLDSLFPDPSEP